MIVIHIARTKTSHRQTPPQTMPAFSSMVRWSLCVAGTVSFLASILMLKALENQYAAFPVQHRLASDHNATAHHGRESTEEVWPHAFIHIINTRFMQHQADLIDLARARLVLFETFCLKSILGQSLLMKDNDTPPLLWIIKTDPDLNPALVKELVSLIKPHPFIYLVASNTNYGIGVNPGGWRGSEAGKDVLQSHVHSGNMTLLRQAHASREKRAILETRLDADDGLHVRLLEAIQAEAYARLRYTPNMTQDRQEWMYWCHLNHLDWSPTPPFTGHSSEYGIFVPYRTAHACITAGITLGVSVGQEEKSIPRFMHHKLYQELGVNKTRATCGSDTCLHMMDKPILGAIRSRTATSAGMRGVKMKVDNEASEHAVSMDDSHLVTSLEKWFHVNISKMKKVNKYMQDNMYAIAADNLRGQCTQGHSCKNSTREVLEDLLAAAKNSTNTSVGVQ